MSRKRKSVGEFKVTPAMLRRLKLALARQDRDIDRRRRADEAFFERCNCARGEFCYFHSRIGIAARADRRGAE
ncbi:MAG: hypothetical protein EPN98_21265 [Phenylobacterium sp.]|uniref:hypothetical protein n=1 Tax=Phenylobacterium sp. TaxID=1871053 RepID=UPI001214404D|nr:hypothetical protein [Phenylobacterium sp.]TAL28974.1 MAG: hypothetical protein EPN98_21265 [Phenylobacterium sp.]